MVTGTVELRQEEEQGLAQTAADASLIMPTTALVGLSVLVTDDTVSMRVPSVACDGHSLSLASVLSDLCEQHPRVPTWTLDLSALRGIPLSVAGVLVNLGDKLHKQGCKLKFIFAPAGVSSFPRNGIRQGS